MLTRKSNAKSSGTRFSVKASGKEIAHAYLYLMKNDLHSQPFGFLEDVFVEESERGKGVGSELVSEIILEAKKKKCYKLICTSRHSKPQVHEIYKKLGFIEQGLEFRIDF